jgi:hypothetical protein
MCASINFAKIRLLEVVAPQFINAKMGKFVWEIIVEN